MDVVEALPSVDGTVRRAHAVGGVLCLTSAALHHGWAVKLLPARPHVSFRKNRKLTPEQRRGIEVHRYDLAPEDVLDGVVTSKEATLLHCLRSLPRDEGLAVADSAARSGELSLLRRVARTARGRGAGQVRDLADLASVEAANPFESSLRAIALEVPGLNVVPQRVISSARQRVKPDLVDEDLRIVLEADSFQWHGDRTALRNDARRYNLLVVDGWTVLRFAWEDVMFDAQYVREVLVAVVAVAAGRTKVACERCGAA